MGQPKALLKLGEQPFLRHVCRALLDAGVLEVVAVLGAEAERVAREAPPGEGVVVVVNEAWTSGMLSSLWRGLDAVEALGAEAVLVQPVDNPSVRPATIRAVLDALAAGAAIAVPCHDGRRGHPAGFARAAWPALRAAAPEEGARAVLREHPEWIVHVEAGADCLLDVDTPRDLAALSET